MANKDKYPVHEVEGILHFPFLQIPRDYKDDGNFAYDTGLLLEGEAAEAFAAFVDEQLAEAVNEFHTGKSRAKIMDPPYDVHTVKDEDTGDMVEVEGVTKFKFKVKAKTKTKKGEWIRRPVFYDAQGQPLAEDDEPPVGTGSEVMVAFQVYGYKSNMGIGIQLQPMDVQILTLVERQERERGSHKFGSREGGWTPPEPDEDEGGAAAQAAEGAPAEGKREF